MSIKLSSLLKLSVASAVLLSVGACKATDKGQGALKSESISALNLSKSEANVFSKHFAIEPCNVDEMEALGALAGLGLGENGTNGVSFKARDFNDNRVTYRDLTLREDGSDEISFSAGTAVFHCAQMGDENPSFGRVDLTNVLIRDDEDDVEVTAETLNIANPTSQAARSIVGNMTKLNTNSVNDGELGAVSMTGVKIKSDELNGTMKAISWGETRDENGVGKADLTIDNVSFVAPGKNGGKDTTIDFAGMSARNMNIGKSIKPGASPDQMVESLFGNFSSFDKPYDELIIESIKIDSEAFTVNSGVIEGKTTQKGKVITTRQSMKPTTITLKPALGNDPSFKKNYDILKSLDLDTMEFSGNSVTTLNGNDDTISVSDGLFVLKDTFRLNFEYAAEGVSEMTQKLKTLQGSNPGVDAFDALKLSSLRITLEDNSIVEKGMKLATEMTGQSETQLKLMLSGGALMAASFAENDIQADVYSKAANAFADFVKKGGTLTLEANPPEAFSFSPFLTGNADTIDPDSLGFSASQAGGTK